MPKRCPIEYQNAINSNIYLSKQSRSVILNWASLLHCVREIMSMCNDHFTFWPRKDIECYHFQSISISFNSGNNDKEIEIKRHQKIVRCP